MKWKFVAFVVALINLGGCAHLFNPQYQVKMMPRDGGVLYSGHANGRGHGSVSANIGGKSYTGTWITVVDSGNLILLDTYGTDSQGMAYRNSGSAQVTSTRGAGVAILSAPDSSGLRCEYKISSGMGVGVCRDDKGRIYDIQIVRE
jgi:hypothetical protein